MPKIMDIPEQITYSTVLLRCYDQKNNLSMGTGFIIDLYPPNDKGISAQYIITNKHVVSSGVRTEFAICKSDENGDPVDTQTVTFVFDNSLWIQHPDSSVDLCCAPLKRIFEGNDLKDTLFYRYLSLDYIPTENTLKTLFAIEEVIMVGYPRGFLDEHNHKPIVRRGITASHPKKDFQGKKETLLDISVFPGSSGSPVFIYNSCLYSTTEGTFMGNPRILLLGVVYGLRPDVEKELLQILKDESHMLIIEKFRETSLNLAFMIKAERILDFAKMLQDVILKETGHFPLQLTEQTDSKE